MKMRSWEKELLRRLRTGPMSLGDRNSARVDLWRARLRSKGFVIAGFGKPFDRSLRSATIVAQLAAGADPDGIVGPETWTKVGKLRKQRRPVTTIRNLVRPSVLDCRSGRNGYPIHAWKRWDLRPSGRLRYKLGHYTGNDVSFINDARFHVTTDYLDEGGAPSIAYGIGVDTDGTVLVFNDPTVTTWHCDGGFNSYTYGIAFRGGTRGPSAVQRRSLRWLYRALEAGFEPRKGERWAPLPARDTVHRKVSATSCPGDVGERFYRSISLDFHDSPTRG